MKKQNVPKNLSPSGTKGVKNDTENNITNFYINRSNIYI